MKDFHFHWQNLNVDKFERKKSPIKYGRCWWHFGERCLGFEWKLGNVRFHLGVDYGGFNDSELMLIFCIPFVSLYLSFENFFKRLRGTDYSRHTGISIHDGSIWIDIRQDTDSWSPKRDKFRHIVITPADILFGKMRYSKTDLKKVETVISMPEGSYPAKITLIECTWKRSRSFLKKVVKRAEIEMEKSIPVPGKGENDWDIDDDAVYSLTIPDVDTIEGAIAGTVKSCLNDRFRIAGYDWVPQNS
jgi:hypothetical protein